MKKIIRNGGIFMNGIPNWIINEFNTYLYDQESKFRLTPDVTVVDITLDKKKINELDIRPDEEFYIELEKLFKRENITLYYNKTKSYFWSYAK